MKRLLIAAAVTFALCGPVHAAGGWNGTTWGMTPEQVIAALPQAKPVERGERMGDKREKTRAPATLASMSLDARMFYDQTGLTMVSVEAPVAKCNAVGNAMLTEHGDPLVISDQTLFRLFIWHDEATETRLRLMVSTAGICTLYFEPLARYRDYDLSHRTQPAPHS